jgi:hypothetical protein
MRVQVECYAGYKADELPTAFTLGERRLRVEEVLDRWYAPDSLYFRVRAEDGDVYILRHAEPDDVWTLESFRRADSVGTPVT